VDRRTALLFGALLLAVVLATAAFALLSPASDPNATLPPGAESMTGVVVHVDSAGGGLGDVQGFTLRRPGGELVDFSLKELQNGTQFPPGHLAEHQATSTPVVVWFRVDGSERLALRLEDAPVAS
jgi:hypothetical protein